VDQKNKQIKLIDWGLAEYYHYAQNYNCRVISIYVT